MHSELMLLVANVKKSAAWYKKLLGATNDHDIDDYDRILSGKQVLLTLHRRDADEHGALPATGGAVGAGCLLWVYVDELDAVYQRARGMKAKILAEPHENPQARWREFTLSDPDGYALGIIER